MAFLDFSIVFFYIFLIVACIVLGILRVTRSKTQNQDVSPSLQEVYLKTPLQDNIVLDNDVKPFSITSYHKQSSMRNALFFINATLNATQSFTTSTMVGFKFTLNNFMRVTALQFVAQYSLINTSHAFAIFDADTRQELTSPLDSVVDSKIDPTNEDGFVTHTLQKPIELVKFKQYIFVALVNLNDFAGPQTMMQLNKFMTIQGGVLQRNAFALTFPTTPLQTSILHFGSFQIQTLPFAIPAPIFDVAMSTGGYSRLPPSYIRGMTFSIKLTTTTGAERHIDVNYGFASSQFAEANIILPLAIRVSPLINGINGLDVGTLQPSLWYSLYVIGSPTIGLPTGAILSLGFQEPNVLPLGYSVFRRLGSVFIEATSEMSNVMQEGDGATRTTYFMETVIERFVFNQVMGSSSGLPYMHFALPFIPASATRCILNVFGRGRTSDIPHNMLIRFRRRFATTEGPWTISVPNSFAFQQQIEISVGNAVPAPHELEIRVFVEPDTKGHIPLDYRVFIGVLAYYETL